MDADTIDTGPAEHSALRDRGLTRWRSAVLPNTAKSEFILPELLDASDETFVATAYRALLRREPDMDGVAHYLGLLRTGGISKVEVLGTLRWSPEGRARSVHVDGLLVPYLLQKWRRKPLIGPVIAWAHALLRLGALARRQQLFEAAAAREAHGLGSVINDLSTQLQSRFERLEVVRARHALTVSEDIASLGALFDQQMQGLKQASIESMAERDQRLSHLHGTIEALGEQLGSIHGGVRKRIDDLQIQLKSRMTAQDMAERDQRLSQLAATVDSHVNDTRSSFAMGKEAMEQHLSLLHGAIEALGEQLGSIHGGVRKRIDDLQIQLKSRMTAQDMAERDQRLSQLMEKHLALLQQRMDAIGSIQAGVEPRLAQVQEAQAKSEELAATRLESLQSQLEMLRPFPAALLAAQQSLGNLMEQQAATTAQLKDVTWIEERIERLRQQLQERLDHIHSAAQGEHEQLARHAEELSGHGAELAAHRSTLHDYGAALSLMDQAKAKELESARALDPLYVAFEDEFRGSRDLIRTRAEPYLDLVREAGLGAIDSPILDLGCGRGEWLELLREHGLVGRGVDSNRVFIDLCRGRGLEVIEGDVIEVMQSLPDGSIGAITGMHIAEHLPFEVLVQLLDEARRLLRPGGLLALETPNPENLQVATHFFYMDPTHRNPLPPEAFRWIVEARGFDQVRIERWAVARETGAPPLLDAGIPGAESVNVLLSQLDAAPDYSIIARQGMA